MKVTRLRQKATDKCITEVIECSSVSEFYDYIMNTPYDKTFENHSHSSVTGSKEFTKTYSFDEAVNLFKNGWVDMSTKLIQKLNVADKNLRSNEDCGCKRVGQRYNQYFYNDRTLKIL